MKPLPDVRSLFEETASLLNTSAEHYSRGFHVKHRIAHEGYDSELTFELIEKVFTFVFVHKPALVSSQSTSSPHCELS